MQTAATGNSHVTKINTRFCRSQVYSVNSDPNIQGLVSGRDKKLLLSFIVS